MIKWSKNDLFPTIDNVWGDFFNNDFFNKRLQLGTSVPAVNIKENDTGYHIEAAIPGCKKEDFKVNVDDGILTLSSESKQEKEEKEGEKTTRKEFSYSSFTRSFTLPENADDGKIEAVYKDGILKLDIPKKLPTQAQGQKTIEVK